MQYKMRRCRQQLSIEQSIDILNHCTNGILSLVNSDGSPYGVPISYVYDNAGHIFIHSALNGHKIDCISHDSRCSFCVVAQDLIVPEEFTTYFRSVIVTGKVRIITDPEEVRSALICLCDKYCPGIDLTDEINKFIKAVKVLRLDIDEITGKESIELVRQRRFYLQVQN